MNKELIVKYTVGEADQQERLSVEAWIAESSDNRREFETMKGVWNIGQEPGPAPEISIDHAWSNFVRMRDGRINEVILAKPEKIRFRMNWIGVAASLVVISSLAFWILQSTLSVEKVLKAGLRIQHAGLPDGSTVHLNANAEMVYHKAWLRKNRSVRLVRGAVFFDVKSDPNRLFEIESGASKITVLGTSFHVRREGTDTEVIVASGAVKVSHRGQELLLKPNQMVVVSDTATQKIRIEQVPDQLYRYYVHQEFIFENTPLPRVFEVLGKAYGKRFVVENEKTRALTYTATFEQQNLNEMVAVILETFDLKVSKRDSIYYID